MLHCLIRGNAYNPSVGTHSPTATRSNRSGQQVAVQRGNGAAVLGTAKLATPV